MNERSMSYIRSAQKLFRYVRVSHICLMLVAMKENMKHQTSELSLVIEAVEYGNLDYLLKVASCGRSSAVRASQVLLFVRSHLNEVNHG